MSNETPISVGADLKPRPRDAPAMPNRQSQREGVERGWKRANSLQRRPIRLGLRPAL